ncbi:alpha/beta hydrolase fold domain-containing protein, partial [Mycobacterium sp. ACS4054]|uniref:alpha/beta hydrolase n=1 Tax=Mycobacterium sp. ACS4054 TaxID=1834119 RepID=UPI0018D2A7A9
MSILSTPVVADALARAFAAVVNPAPKAAVRFPEIPGETSQVTIPTRHGPVPATVYHPPAGTTNPPVYVNVHGGGFVIGHPQQDDPWCRYLAAHGGAVVVNPDYVLAPRPAVSPAPPDGVAQVRGGGPPAPARGGPPGGG